MKKLFILGLLAGFVGSAYAACVGPFCWDETGAYVSGSIQNGNGSGLPSLTKAQSIAATPNAAGQEIYCSDCTTAKVCVSTGTGRGAYVVAAATGTFAGSTYPTCQ